MAVALVMPMPMGMTSVAVPPSPVGSPTLFNVDRTWLKIYGRWRNIYAGQANIDPHIHVRDRRTSCHH